MHNQAKLLVIDDTPTNLEVLTETLSAKGFDVTVAISGERALKRLESYRPDLILLDIQMPGIDGFETCQRIKAHPELATIPVIFITALSDADNIVKGFSLGAVDYISKPFKEAELFARIETHLRLQQLTHCLSQQVTKKTQSLQQALHQLESSQLQLVQQEKMSALGELVAGVAHEINNPIGFVQGNVKELQRNLTDVFSHLNLYQQQTANAEIEEHAEDIDLDFLLEDMPKMLESMMVGCDRIRNISTSLRTFSREDQDTQIPFDLHEGIDSTLLILKHRLKANDQRPEIAVIKHYGDLPLVSCFPGQLNQVFMNLLANAIDALEERSQQPDGDPLQITIKTIARADQVHIHLRDNGLGMSADVQQRVFDRLYTTKPAGKGTGLGLAISRQIVVEKHGGKIEVESTPDHGTEFTLTLPVNSEDVPHA
ncbi:MAG: response regulator [Cyanobacteria bacterium P01_D01_bin.1]